MIWQALYLCFLTSTNTEIDNSIVWLIENGTEKQAIKFHNEHCK
jgi:hypothetical protein